jgi:DNA-binding HxlR family transcriptional regulator
MIHTQLKAQLEYNSHPPEKETALTDSGKNTRTSLEQQRWNHNQQDCTRVE